MDQEPEYFEAGLYKLEQREGNLSYEHPSNDPIDGIIYSVNMKNLPQSQIVLTSEEFHPLEFTSSRAIKNESGAYLVLTIMINSYVIKKPMITPRHNAINIYIPSDEVLSMVEKGSYILDNLTTKSSIQIFGFPDVIHIRDTNENSDLKIMIFTKKTNSGIFFSRITLSMSSKYINPIIDRIFSLGLVIPDQTYLNLRQFDNPNHKRNLAICHRNNRHFHETNYPFKKVDDTETK